MRSMKNYIKNWSLEICVMHIPTSHWQLPASSPAGVYLLQSRNSFCTQLMQAQSAFKQYPSNRDITRAIIFLFRVKLRKYKGNFILNKLPSSQAMGPDILFQHTRNLTFIFALLEAVKNTSLANTSLCSNMIKKLENTSLQILFLNES